MHRRSIFCLFVSAVLMPSFAEAQNRAPSVSRVDFDFLNDIGEGKGVPQLVGREALPFKLQVRQMGNWKKKRRLQALIVIYAAAAPTGLKTGKLINAYQHPKIMSTEAGQEQTATLEDAVDLPAGDYVVHVFFCDPDAPFVDIFNSSKFPAAEQFPGAVLRGKAARARVLP